MLQFETWKKNGKTFEILDFACADVCKQKQQIDLICSWLIINYLHHREPKPHISNENKIAEGFRFV